MDFCETFTHRYRDSPADVRQLRTDEVRADRNGSAVSRELLPETNILYEVREGQQDGRSEIMVTVRNGADDTSFLIENVVALFSRGEGDICHGLRVDSGSGVTTLVILPGQER